MVPCHNRLTFTDGAGHVTTYTYDDDNRVSSVTNALNGTTTVAYYVSGWVKQVTDPKGLITLYDGYDAVGRLTHTVDPLGHATSYAYDYRGNRVSMVDAKGQTTGSCYDLSNRRTAIMYSTGQTCATASVRFTYDSNGNRTQIVDGTGTTNYAYNSVNQPTSVTYPNGQGITYNSYDNAGNLTSLTLPTSKTVTYGYESNSLMKTVTAAWLNTGSNQVAYTRDAAGRVTLTAYPDHTQDSYTYDAAGRTASIFADTASGYTLAGGGTVINHSSYGRDNAGNITSITGEAQGNSSFGYDALNRLTGATYPANPSTLVTAQTFSYDANGNRTQHTTIANGVTTTYTYGYTLNGASQATNQLSTLTPSGGSATTYTHDTNGNRTAPVDAAILNGTASYNVPNYQTQTSTNAGTTTYSYNGDGLRYQETRGGTTTFIWDSYRRVPQVVYDGTNTYLYGLGRLARVNGTSTVFYHTDVVGSTRALTRWNGTNVVIEAAFSYEAFGKIRAQSGTALADNDFLFAGEQWDSETGNYYLRARYLDPGTGRFLIQDPAGSGSSPYPYAGNNPLRYTDPMGLDPETPGGENRDPSAPCPVCSIPPRGYTRDEWAAIGRGDAGGGAIAQGGWQDPRPRLQFSYAYTFGLGMAAFCQCPELAMGYLQAHWNDLFPGSTDCGPITPEKAIAGTWCQTWFIVGGPIRLLSADALSFSFLGGPGHPQEGARVTFRTFMSGSVLSLSISAEGGPDGVWPAIEKTGTYAIWATLASRLGAALFNDAFMGGG